MKLTKEERKFHHKLSKWRYRNELDSGEYELVGALRHQVGKTNVSINLEKISKQIVTVLCTDLFEIKASNIADMPELAEFKAEYQKKIINGFKQLQDRGFIEVVSSKDWKEHTVNVIPVWEKKS